MYYIPLQSIRGEGTGRKQSRRRFGLVWDTDHSPVSVLNFSGAEGCVRESWRRDDAIYIISHGCRHLLNIVCYAMVLEIGVSMMNPSCSTAQSPHVMWEVSMWLDLSHHDFLRDSTTSWRSPHPLSSGHLLTWQAIFFVAFAICQLSARLKHRNIIQPSCAKEQASRPSLSTQQPLPSYFLSPVSESDQQVFCLVLVCLDNEKLVSPA